MFKAFLLAALVAAGFGSPAAAACTVPANAAELQSEVAQMMNAERRRRGQVTLQFSPQLQRAAERHACDMARNGIRSHTGSDRSSFQQRFQAVGGCITGGENIAWMQSGPAMVMRGWMNSPPHRSNIMLSEALSYGIAVTVSNAGQSWVMVVGRAC